MLGVPGVQQAVVTTHEREPGLTELVGYYTTRDGVDGVSHGALAREIRTHLPPYMVPAFFEELAGPSHARVRQGRPQAAAATAVPALCRRAGRGRRAGGRDGGGARLVAGGAHGPRGGLCRGALLRRPRRELAAAGAALHARARAPRARRVHEGHVPAPDGALDRRVRAEQGAAAGDSASPAGAGPARRPAAVRALRRAPAAVLRRLHADRRGGVRRGLRLDRGGLRSRAAVRALDGVRDRRLRPALCDPRGPQVEPRRALEGGSDRHLGAGLRALLDRSAKRSG